MFMIGKNYFEIAWRKKKIILKYFDQTKVKLAQAKKRLTHM